MVPTTQGPITDAYVSSIDFLHSRDIYDTLYDAKNESSILDFFEKTGRKKESEQTVYRHFERDFVYQNFTILAKAGTGVGVDTLITLSPADHENGASYPRVGDEVLFKNTLTGLIVAKDTAVSTAHVITVRPVDNTEDVGAAAILGDSLTVFSNAHAEGTGQPKGMRTKPLEFNNQHQIFKNHYSITGSEDTNKLEITIDGMSYYRYEGEHAAFLKHRGDECLGLMLGKRSVGLTNAAGEEVRTTNGLLNEIKTYGNQQPGGIASLANIDTIIKTLDKKRGSKENLFLVGVDLDIDIDNVLIDKMLAGGIQYNSFGKGDARQKSIDLGFSSFKKGSWTFHKKQLEEFNHPNVTGSVDYPYPGMGFIVPTDKGADYKTGKTMDSICVRYKKAAHQNRELIHKVTGLHGTNGPSSDIDETGFEYLSEKGLECFGLHRFMLITQ